MEGIGVSNPHLQAMEFGHLEVVPQPLGTYDYHNYRSELPKVPKVYNIPIMAAWLDHIYLT